MPILEVCVDSIDDAVTSVENGAHRIEFCSHLELDGLSPTIADVELLLSKVNIPVHVMVRLKEGPFVCSDEDVGIMIEYIKQLKTLSGVRGVVVGLLDQDNQIDVFHLKQIIEVAKPLSITFHRAFDYIDDQYQTLLLLKSLQVDRVLTSGKPGPAIENLEILKALVQYGNQIGLAVMIGGKVRVDNVKKIVETTNVKEVHSSKSFDLEKVLNS